MNNKTIKIANILQSQLDQNYHEFQNIGLSSLQLEEIDQYVKLLSRNSPVFPFPLKTR